MADGVGDADQVVFVLTETVIRWGIEELLDRKVHAFFPAYLEIRRAALEAESGSAVQPDWGILGGYLAVPGGPPKKPYFRPFWHQSRKAGQDWLNENIAGSYAPSSIRKVPATVVLPDGSGYALRGGHARLALKNLLYGQQLPAYPLVTFYYRNFGFTTDGPALSPDGLIDIFREDFGFRDEIETEEFGTLFSTDIPDRTDWFEPWRPPPTSLTEDGSI
jgi:hypothetical protein